MTASSTKRTSELNDIDSIFAGAVAALRLPLGEAGTREAIAAAIAAAEAALPAARAAAEDADKLARRPHATIAEATAARTAAEAATFAASRLESLVADLRARATAAEQEAGRIGTADEWRAAAAERDALVAEGPAVAAAIALLVDFTQRHEANAARLAQVNAAAVDLPQLVTAESILSGRPDHDTAARHLRQMRLPSINAPGLAWPPSTISMLTAPRPKADELAAHPMRRIYRGAGPVTVSIFNGSMKVGPVPEGGRPSEARMSDAQVDAARADGCHVENVNPAA